MNRKFNIFFWLIIALLLLLLFGKVTGNYIYSFYFLSFFMPVVIVTSLTFNQILISQYLLRKKWRPFFLYSFYLLIVSLDLEMILVFLSFYLISLFDYGNISTIISNYKWIPAVMYLIVILSAFIQVVAELINKQGQENISHSSIIIRADRKNRKLKLSDIAYIESMSDYLSIHLLSDEVIVTREKISNISERLTATFLRIHRSFIINIEHLESYTREEVIVLGKELPISRTYKKEVIDRLHSNHD